MEKRFVAMLLILSMLAQVAYALSAAMTPVKMVVRANVTEGETATVSRFFSLRNTNNISVVVKLEPDASLKDIIRLNEQNISLGINESRKVDFDIVLTQAGNYTGSIMVTFSPKEPGERPVAIATNLIIYATHVDKPAMSPVLVVGAVLVLAIIAFAVSKILGSK